MNRKRERRRERRLVARAAKFVRELFSTTPPEPGDRPPPDDLVGGLGVREPRRPLQPNMSGAVALELPPSERTDVWAVGEDERG